MCHLKEVGLKGNVKQYNVCLVSFTHASSNMHKHTFTNWCIKARWYKKHNIIVVVLNQTQLCDYMFKQKELVYDEVWAQVGRLRSEITWQHAMASVNQSMISHFHLGAFCCSQFSQQWSVQWTIWNCLIPVVHFLSSLAGGMMFPSLQHEN